MPKCITCGLRTWFKALDCDCKNKALKERARPVIPKTQPARHTPTRDFHGRPMATEIDNSVAHAQTASIQHQTTMAMINTEIERPNDQPVTADYKHCHTPSVSSHSHHDHGPSHSSPSYESSPSYSSESCGGGSSYSD